MTKYFCRLCGSSARPCKHFQAPRISDDAEEVVERLMEASEKPGKKRVLPYRLNWAALLANNLYVAAMVDRYTSCIVNNSVLWWTGKEVRWLPNTDGNPVPGLYGKKD